MTDKEIENIVDKTIKRTFYQLKAAGALKSREAIIYKHVSDILTDYYKHDVENERLESALEELENDAYFDIIPLYYFSDCTIEHLAAKFEVDASTITRNKRRLCMELYERMGGNEKIRDLHV